MAIGSLVMTLLSGWTSGVRRHGAAVIIAAAVWGLAIVALGFAPTLPLAVVCLAVAGAADMISGTFRQTIWNHTIPNELRGRLSGVEMISYMTGPLLGNARAGWVATRFDAFTSIVSGGVLCVVGVLACKAFLPCFGVIGANLSSCPRPMRRCSPDREGAAIDCTLTSRPRDRTLRCCCWNRRGDDRDRSRANLPQ